MLIVAVLFSLYEVGDLTPADIGFMLSYTTAMLGMTQYMVRQACEVDNLVSLKQFYEVTNIKWRSICSLSPPL